MVQKNEIYTVAITGISSEGNGVGKIEGMTVFVPLTAAGDLVQVKVVKLHKTYCYGRVEKLLHPSADRIPVDCAAFAQCGGCAYRHIRYESELKLKEQLVKDAFERLGKIQTEHLPIVGSQRIDEYRNKAQYPVGLDKDGRLCAGFYANRSHRIISGADCRLQNPTFEKIKQVILQYAQQHRVSAYDEKTGKGMLRHIYLRHAEQTGEWMAALVVTADSLPHTDELVKRLTDAVPEIASVVLNINPKQTNVILGKECRVLYGTDRITDRLCGNRISLSPLSFYQVNHDQAEVLYEIAKEFAELTGKETVVDLYCGAGTIGLSMAKESQRIIGAEIIPEAVENAKQNAAQNGIHNAQFLCADAAEATAYLREQGLLPDVVVVDPPRKGCGAAVLEDIAAMSPKRLVMISCNPATAARDCAVLEEKGYQTIKVQAVDMFPRTTHVECIVCLVRK